MLSPNVKDMSDRLAVTYNNMLQLKKFAFSCNGIQIAKLSPDPDWLIEVRSRIGLLNNECVLILNTQSDMKAAVLRPFVNYYNTFSSYAEISDQFNDKDTWLAVLADLKESLEQCKISTETASRMYNESYKNIRNIQILLTNSINSGWIELAAEQNQMMKIATELTHLQDKLSSLQSSMTTSQMMSGKSYIQSSVSMTYSLVQAGAAASISYLSVAGLAFTIGSTFYDIFKTNADIADTLGRITALQEKASQAAQAAAATKMLLQLCYNLELEFNAMSGNLPYLTEMWKVEMGKVNTTINALKTGSDPKHLLDLKLKPAAATWKTLSDACQRISLPLENGPLVDITISKK